MPGGRLPKAKHDYGPFPHQGRFHKAARSEDYRFFVLSWGRRAGKDRCSVYQDLLWMDQFLREKREKSLVPKVHMWAVAPTYRLTSQLWMEFKAFIPDDWIYQIRESDKAIWLRDGGLIEMRSADNPQSLVSVGLDILHITEGGLVNDEAWSESLRPTLSSPGRAGLAVINGTPKGKNWFFRAYNQGQSDEYPLWWSSREPTSANPLIPETEIEEMRQTMPERVFRQEVLADFIEGEGWVFRNIEEATIGALQEPAEQQTVIGVDIGRTEDFTVISVVERGTDYNRLIGYDRFTHGSYDMIQKRTEAMVRKWRPQRAVIETNAAGAPLFEALSRSLPCATLGFNTNAQSKPQLIENLALMIEQGQLVFPAIPELITELQAYEYELTRSGNIKYGAPRGFHDDWVISLALAAWGVRKPMPRISYLDIDLRNRDEEAVYVPIETQKMYPEWLIERFYERVR